MVGTQRLNVTTSYFNPHDRNLHIPLPITLLDYCTVYRDRDIDWLPSSKLTKISSNKVLLNSDFPSLQHCLPSFRMYYGQGEATAKAGLELPGLQNSQVVVEIEQSQGHVSVHVLFSENSPNACSLGKVAMQALLFLLQK
jgi:hypothetical protein